MPVGIGAAISTGLGLGLGTTAAGILGGSLLGAAGGALVSGVTGGNPLYGALGGAVTGGFGGAAGGLAGDLGITSAAGTTALGAGLGAAGGALGSEITGGNPLYGAVSGGVLGGVEGYSAAPSGTGVASAPGTASAAGVGPPAGVANTPVDLTTQYAQDVTGIGVPNLAPSLPSTVATSAADTGSDITSQLQAVQSQFGGPAGAATDTGSAVSSTATGSGGGGILGSLEKAVGKNPLGALAAGGGLLYNMFTGSNTNKEIGQLKAQANAFGTQGNALASYLQSGTLPTGLQALVDRASNSAKAQVRSTFAGMGLSGSTQEATALQQVDQNTLITTAQIGEGLLTTGINESNLSTQLLEGVIGAQTAQNKQTASAISGLAAALSGSSSYNFPKVTIG